MRAGPKVDPVESLDLSALPAGGADRVLGFVAEFCRLPHSLEAGERLRLRDWQVDIVRGLFDDRPRQALITMGRKNGKSGLAACLALFGLFADAEQGEGRSVVIVSTDERTAKHLFDTCARMVELDARLFGCCQVFQKRILHPASGSSLEVLPATAARLQGRNPTMAIADEVHEVDEAVWDAMALATGTRPAPLILGLTTAGGDRDSLLWRLLEKGRAGDASIRLWEWSAPPGADVRDESAWAAANPGLGDILAVEHLRTVVETTREAVFRRYHMNEWTGVLDAWLPWGVWEPLADPSRMIEGPITVAFDGSASGDSTTLVGCTIDDPHLFMLGAWQAPNDPRWRVPRADVDDRVTEVMETFDVRELSCDPWGWRSEIEEWGRRWPGRVLELPTNIPSRMGPACDRLFAAISEGTVSHDGDQVLATHMRNAVAKSTAHGDLITKERKNSRRKIDAAVSAVIAFDRAAWHAQNGAKRSRKMVVIG